MALTTSCRVSSSRALELLYLRFLFHQAELETRNPSFEIRGVLPRSSGPRLGRVPGRSRPSWAHTRPGAERWRGSEGLCARSLYSFCMRPVRAGELGVGLRLLGEPGSEPDPMETGLENITTWGGRPLVVPLSGWAPVPLGGGPPPLRLQPRRLGRPGRLGRLPLSSGWPGRRQRPPATARSRPPDCEAGSACHSTPASKRPARIQPRPQSLEQLRSLLRAEAGRAGHVPPDLDPSGRGVHVLATGSARARRLVLQLRKRKAKIGSDL